jgi:RNA polymerase sigma-70 factor (ECF subfamily)
VSLPSLSPADVTALRDGDPAARQRLAASVVATVLRWSTHLAGPRIDPEDVAHDVIVQVLQHVGELRDPAAFPAWLYRSTRREIARQQRRRWLTDLLPGLGFGEDLPAPAPVDDVTERVRAAVRALPEGLREVLVLSDVEGYTDPEVAELLGVPLGTVKSRLSRARQRFEAEARSRDLAPELPTGAGG